MTTNTMRKAGLAGLLAATAWGQAAAFSLSDSDGSTVLGGTANPGITISFDESFSAIGGELLLQWSPGSLSFTLEPAALSINGVAWSTLLPTLDSSSNIVTSATGDGVTVYANAKDLMPIELSAPLVVGLGLKGLAAGEHTVQYTVTLYNDMFETTALSDSLKVTVSAVPEPTSAALLLAGLLGVAALARRAAPRGG